MNTPASSGMPGGGVVTSQSPPFTLPIRYMILGIFGFGLFALDIALQAIHLGAAGTLMPGEVALTHLLTLGSLLAFVMGAVYQLSTVAFLIPIAALRFARLNFWLYSVSATGLIISMAQWWMPGLTWFGSLMTLSIYIYALVIIVSVAKTKVRGAMQAFVLAAHVYLILAVTAAILLITLFQSGQFARFITELLATHILLALGGFFTFLVMGFSFKLLPMFTLSHGFPTWRQKWTLILCHTALWLCIVSVWGHWRPLLAIGALIGMIAFGNQLLDIRSIIVKRLRKKIEPPIRAVLVAGSLGIAGLCLLFVQVVLSHGLAGWQGVVTFYLLGWITLTIMGYAYKIVPFLVWSKRYSKRVEKGKTPLIADLINLNQSCPVLAVFGLGLLLLTASSFTAWLPGSIGGCILIAIAILVFCVQILRVINPGKVYREFIDRD